MTATTTSTLPFISVTLIVAFAGIVAGLNVNRQANLTTEIFNSEDTTRNSNNETTVGHTTQKPPTTYSTVQTTHFTTAEPKVVTFNAETNSKLKPVIKLRPRSSTTTTIKPTTVSNVTVSSTVSSNETDQATNATTPGMILKNSSEGNLNTITSSQLNDSTTVIETVSSTQANKPTEVTKPDSLKRVTPLRETKPETTPTPTISTEETTFFQKTENSTFSTEGRDIKKDPIEQELDDTMNSMPKLPELALSNETHFKFHQDPEEASLDERITQIARQLAETGLRREYEERKLGHFIPISVRPIEYNTPNYHSKGKSIKFVKSETPDFRPGHYKSTLLKVFTKTKSGPGIENLDKTAYELVTNLPEILRKNKSDKQISEMNRLIKVGGKGYNSGTTDMISTNFPIFFELLKSSEKGNSGTETKPESQSVATTTTAKYLTTVGKRLTDDTTYYSYIETTENS